MQKLKLISFLIIGSVFWSYNLFAQSSADQTIQDYANNPAWIKMMDDPKTNYYEAVKAYDEYWNHHVKPVEEEEEEMTGTNPDFKEHEREVRKEQKKNKDKVFSPEEIKAREEYEQMKYQVKRFEQWKREVLPFVQEDGRILSDEERMEIWKKQQEEINNQHK